MIKVDDLNERQRQEYDWLTEGNWAAEFMQEHGVAKADPDRIWNHVIAATKDPSEDLSPIIEYVKDEIKRLQDTWDRSRDAFLDEPNGDTFRGRIWAVVNMQQRHPLQIKKSPIPPFSGKLRLLHLLRDAPGRPPLDRTPSDGEFIEAFEVVTKKTGKDMAVKRFREDVEHQVSGKLAEAVANYLNDQDGRHVTTSNTDRILRRLLHEGKIVMPLDLRGH